MDYEKKYEEALERAKKWRNAPNVDKIPTFANRVIDEIFPELCESEDEKIRKTLKHYLEVRRCQTQSDEEYINCNNFLAWLEKQGGQKPADKVEPKFKVKYAGNEYNVFDIKASMGIIWYGIEDEPNHIDYIKADSCEIISGISGCSKPTDKDMVEALRTEYEKGRADAIAEIRKKWDDSKKKRQEVISFLESLRLKED